MDEYIGIVVKNQWDDILLYDRGFYIKAKVKRGEDINKVIKQEIGMAVGKDFYKIVKAYDKKIKHRDEEIKLYLVEVPVYTNEFEFMKIEDIEVEILNFEDKEYFKNNILKYDECSTFLSTILNFSMLVLFVEIFKIIPNHIFMETMIMCVVGFILISSGFNKYIKPNIEESLDNLKVNIKLYNILIRIMIVAYCVKSIY